MRFRFNDLLLFLLLFVFVAAFPVNLITKDPSGQLAIQIGLRLLILAYYVYLIIKNRIKVFGVANIRNLLICTPFVLIGTSNIIATLIDGYFVLGEPDYLYVSLFTIYHLVAVIIEEIVFRLFIHSALVRTTSTKRIFASAGIFALVHLLNIVNISSVDALLGVAEQVIYSFGLGILLGLVYEYSHSLTGCVILHFSFNFLNTILPFILGAHNGVLAYYLSAIISAVVVGGYAAIIWIFVFKRPERYYRS